MNLGIDTPTDMWLDEVMTTTTAHTAKHIDTFGTSQMHEFRPSGCAHQWADSHDHHECWIAFLRYNNAPTDTMTVTEYYDSLEVK